MKKANGPRILLVDIETAPVLGYVWGLFDQNVAINQIAHDWHVLSFCAKWLGESDIIYADQHAAKNIEDDKHLLEKVWKLLDEADIVIGHNSRRFDTKKLNARFILNGMQPPSSYRHIDTLEIAKRHFSFTSNKLEYLSKTLNAKYKKQDHKKFPGFELWKECLAGNMDAWHSMEKYNRYDVLALEELYTKLAPWDNSLNFNVFNDTGPEKCSCGGIHFQRRGFYYTSVGKYQKHRCMDCGKETRSRENLLSVDKRKSIRIPTVR